MRRKLVALIILSIMMCGLTGCLSEEQKEQVEKYEEQAEENAIDYIEEKYGFKAKVISSKYTLQGDPPSPSSYCIVTMQYEGTGFKVYIDGYNEYNDFDNIDKSQMGDNYQSEDIQNDLEEYLKDLGVDIKKVYYNYTAISDTSYRNLTSSIYNGNIQKFMEENGGIINIITVEQNKDNINNEVLNKCIVDINIYDVNKKYYEDNIKKSDNSYYISKYNSNVNWYIEK